jgi:hypothetical protein
VHQPPAAGIAVAAAGARALGGHRRAQCSSPAPAPRRTRRLRRWLVSLAVVLALAAGTAAALLPWLARRPLPLPPVEPRPPAPLFIDLRPYAASISVPGGQLPWPTTVDAVGRDVPLWRMMHLADWNRVPSPLREEALDRMLALYGPILASPQAWDRMGPTDWDQVPQPVRTVAYRHMTDYWAGYYDLGGAFGLPAGLVADTLAAIVMSESWFEHRAIGVNRDGTADVGLGGASEFARARLRQLHEWGVVDAALSDDDYADPWKATRFVALWLGLMLGEADGDLDRAIAAYNRGIVGADDRLGQAYLETVRRRRARFIRNQGAPVAWDHVWRRARRIEHDAWPWLGPVRPAAAATAGAAGPPDAEDHLDDAASPRGRPAEAARPPDAQAPGRRGVPRRAPRRGLARPRPQR